MTWAGLTFLYILICVSHGNKATVQPLIGPWGFWKKNKKTIGCCIALGWLRVWSSLNRGALHCFCLLRSLLKRGDVRLLWLWPVSSVSCKHHFIWSDTRTAINIHYCHSAQSGGIKEGRERREEKSSEEVDSDKRREWMMRVIWEGTESWQHRW